VVLLHDDDEVRDGRRRTDAVDAAPRRTIVRAAAGDGDRDDEGDER